LFDQVSTPTWKRVRMATYKIDDAGVFGELTKTSAAAEPLQGHRKAFFRDLADAAEGSRSDIVSSALLRFAQQSMPRLNGMQSRINRAITNTSKAAGFYILADQAMSEQARRYERRAAAAQRAALAAPGPDGLYGKK
jgi:hypothetical protein